MAQWYTAAGMRGVAEGEGGEGCGAAMDGRGRASCGATCSVAM